MPQAISRDPDDDKFIACALAAKVRWIISGYKDLLSIPDDIGIEVITPAKFLREHLQTTYKVYCGTVMNIITNCNRITAY